MKSKKEEPKVDELKQLISNAITRELHSSIQQRATLEADSRVLTEQSFTGKKLEPKYEQMKNQVGVNINYLEIKIKKLRGLLHEVQEGVFTI